MKKEKNEKYIKLLNQVCNIKKTNPPILIKPTSFVFENGEKFFEFEFYNNDNYDEFMNKKHKINVNKIERYFK